MRSYCQACLVSPKQACCSLCSVHSLQLTGVEGIHILCHSMGNYVLQQALVKRVLAAEPQPQLAPSQPTVPSKIMTVDAARALFARTKSIIFAAPDIGRPDMERMLEELNAAEGAQGRQLVLYCSKHDRPLMMSSLLRSCGGDGSGRAGFYWPGRKGCRIHPFMAATAGGRHGSDNLLKTVDASSRSMGVLRVGNLPAMVAAACRLSL